MTKLTIVFVHGLGGEPASTWGRFNEFLNADPETKDFESPISRAISQPTGKPVKWINA